MNNPIHLVQTIHDDLAGMRLDAALAQLFPQYSRSKLQQWIESGHVTINKRVVFKNKERVIPGQVIEISAVIEDLEEWHAQDLPLDIVFEDKAIIVINKPPHLVVHPGAGNPASTLVNALLHYDPLLHKMPRAGLIHRLDKDTSGLLVVARTIESHHSLIKQMQNRMITRIYEAIVHGVVARSGTVALPLGRHPLHRTKMSVLSSGGKEAITHYTIIEKMRSYTYLEVQLETGRTHQIRVHLAHINHPILGDPLYGKAPKIPPGTHAELAFLLKNFKRQALHAKKLSFAHPFSEKYLTFEAPPPKDFSTLLDALEKDAENQ